MGSVIKSGSIVVRASAILPAAGAYDAYDASSNVITCKNGVQVELHIDYTRHVSATIGQPKFKLMVSDVDTGDVTTFRDRTIEDSTLTVVGGEARTPLYTAAKLLPVPAGAPLEGRTYIVDVGSARRMMVLFAEAGDTTNRGVVACAATLLGGVQ